MHRQITARMQDFIREKQIAGAVTLVGQGDEIVHLTAVGHSDLAADRPMTSDSIFRIASMTKPITATALLMLQDEGKLSVEDPVSRYIPAFGKVSFQNKPLAKPLTIRHLMTHTSGIARPPRTGDGQDPTLAEIADAIAAKPLGFEPGSRWQYGSGLTVCGRIIEVVSGKPYEVFLAERIFKPLGMVDSCFVLPASKRHRLAAAYQPTKDKKSIEPSKHPWMTFDPTLRRTPNPSGGLMSTAADMCRFYQMILNGGVRHGRRMVSEAAVRQMTRLQTRELKTGFTPGNGWGLGWCIVREPQGVTGMLSPGTYGHGGAWGTQGWVDPERQMIFVLMIQRTNFGNSDGSQVRGEFQRIAVETAK